MKTSTEILENIQLSWLCSFCQNQNDDIMQTCSCGKTYEESNEYFYQTELEKKNIEKKNNKRKILFIIEKTKEYYYKLKENVLSIRFEKINFRKKLNLKFKKNYFIKIIIPLFIITSSIFIFFYKKTKSENQVEEIYIPEVEPWKIVGKTWQTETILKRYQWVQRQDWHDELKGQVVEIIKKEKRVRSYEDSSEFQKKTQKKEEFVRVQDGFKDVCQIKDSKRICEKIPQFKTKKEISQIDVYVKERKPVQEEFITYLSKIYIPIETKIFEGKNDEKPKWHEFKIESGTQDTPDIVQLSEPFYFIEIKHLNGERKKIKVDKSTWQKQYQINHLLSEESVKLIDNTKEIRVSQKKSSSL